ncbi:MAG TPA: lanthionine synthetase LanC family protein [Actinospica sp.]|nr:lanthionine synthetase LanC family protein [Actinospica sp.]
MTPGPGQDAADGTQGAVCHEDLEARVARTLRERPGPGHLLRTTDTWLYLRPPALDLPPHGWKLHVSSSVAGFTALVETLLPVLLDAECSFKLARSHDVLTRLNNGYSSPATVGKAFTVYGETGRIHELGLRLAGLLRGRPGPRVLSDRAVAPDAPVYYRYGPFTSHWSADAHARLITVIHGPDPGDEEFGSLATMRYRQPSWAVDPFTGVRGSAQDNGEDPTPSGPQYLGGHYRLLEGVLQSGRGNVFRALDERDGSRVIVKQARALVDETDASGDARLRVRNERRVLQALAGVAGVSRFLDHFRHGADEFLVTDDAGPYNLAQDITHHGRYRPGDGPRSLERLAGSMARVLLDVHAHGVIMRDLTPRNVVVDGSAVTLIDFGLAALEGVHLPGGTPGYAPARQRRHGEPSEADDLFGLGMTLLYAESNVNPLTLGDDLGQPAERALQSLRLRYGARPTGVMGAIADLLGPEDVAREAARALAAGEIGTRPCARKVLPAAPEITDELVAEICDGLLTDLLDQSHRGMIAQPSRSIAHDACVYSGAAGSGLELLHHLDGARRDEVRTRLDELARFAVRAADEMALPHGYLAGRTGVDVFLARAAAAGVGPGDAYQGPAMPDGDWTPEGIDLMVGAAGVGVGHLVLHELDGRTDQAQGRDHSQGQGQDHGQGQYSLGLTHLDVAHRCARAILDGTATGRTEADDALPAQAAVETSAGRAHGLAGTTDFLLYYIERTRDPEATALTADWARLLSKRTESLLERLQTPYSAPIAVSWCQGMAGISQTLMHAADVLADPEFDALARRVGDACVAFLPHVSVAAQCCGYTGVGNMLIDLAARTNEERYLHAAERAATLMLLRSAGSPSRPLFVADAPEDGSASWAFGNAGILAFFRRLAARGGPWSLPMPSEPRPAAR